MTKGIQFNRLTIKNFLSFGATPTVIDLRGKRITVVMGLNHDTGGDESRNGVGKSALIDSISYALFGKTIRGISNAKLVNKMAKKGQGMLVVLDFDTPEGIYRLERGEAPSRMKLFRKDLDDEADILSRDGNKFIYDITRGKNDTTAQIEEILGFDIKLFEFLIANSSESTAFMNLPEDKKRDIAERLMGLNLLAERAEELREERKDKKKDLVSMESAFEATQQANERIERQVADLVAREVEWEAQHRKKMADLKTQIEQMASVDVAEQIELLKMIDELEDEQQRVTAERREANLVIKSAKRDLADLTSEINRSAARFKTLGDQKRKLDESTCPTCLQHWVPDTSVVEAVVAEIDEISDFSEQAVELLDIAEKAVAVAESRLEVIDEEEAAIVESVEEIAAFELLFDDVEAASAASTVLENNRANLIRIEAETNPHTDTIKGLTQEAIHKVDDGDIREMRKLIAHYNYLIDLLQNKDSFLRKAVIDRWLPRLNGRISHYLDILELPFTVRIENDLSMSITDFGEEFDWGNLSKGQRQRVTIALNLSFQDLFEATNQPLSLLMVDELVDSGICNRGAVQAVVALRETCANKDKRVFLITHRMDIADQIDDVITVEMRNRISRIQEDEYVEEE